MYTHTNTHIKGMLSNSNALLIKTEKKTQKLTILSYASNDHKHYRSF